VVVVASVDVVVDSWTVLDVVFFPPPPHAAAIKASVTTVMPKRVRRSRLVGRDIA